MPDKIKISKTLLIGIGGTGNLALKYAKRDSMKRMEKKVSLMISLKFLLLSILHLIQIKKISKVE